ncbi:tRNA-ribosyltransferase family protein [Limosilactobacillus kribbianus]|uniref:tRNA-ribosyltransferase family protein n=1 Tax=Limosilactobacillus kribbianus TaxID=2982695 RepID=UPI0022650B45|nr:tRNA guanosine(34) transglycosylase Tgt [Limosilactobacillus kribbianus]
MTAQINFQVQYQKSGAARTGNLTVNSRQALTPAIVQTGSATTTLTSTELHQCGTQLIKCDVLDSWRQFKDHLTELPDLHTLTHWDGLIITDSGAEQAYAWAKPRGRKPAGVNFHDPQTGAMHFYTPADALAVQQALGADLRQSFARMADYYAPVDDLNAAVEQTAAWLQSEPLPENCLATVVGGGLKRARRANVNAVPASAAGYSIAGVDAAVPTEEQVRLVKEVITMLPALKLRYLPTSGDLRQLLLLASNGVDLIDSDLAGREASMGNALVGARRLHLDRDHMALDQRVLVPGCSCPVCQAGISRAWIHRLLVRRQPLGERYLLLHNLFTVNQALAKLRAAIAANSVADCLAEFNLDPAEM